MWEFKGRDGSQMVLAFLPEPSGGKEWEVVPFTGMDCSQGHRLRREEAELS